MHNRPHTPEARARIAEAQRARHAEQRREEAHQRAASALYLILEITGREKTREQVIDALALECLRTSRPEDRKRWERWVGPADEIDTIRNAQELLDNDAVIAALTA